MQWDVRIPLRDGIHLSAILYLPKDHEAPSAAIFTMTPYTAQRHHARGMHFAAQGYPFLSVDVRGRGNSQGEFHPLNDGHDGYDIVEWLARQPYCNGKVAMWGGSYLGFAQWAVAKELPPHLATIVPAAAAFYGVDVPLRNNVFPTYSIRWMTMVSGSVLQDKLFGDEAFWNGKFKEWLESGRPFRDLDTRVGNPSAQFQEWLAHPQQDEYWDRHNPTAEQCTKISLPILTITGTYDGDQPGALAHYRQHIQNASPEARAKHYLVIGPWDHAGSTGGPREEFCGLKVGPASLLDHPKLHLEWYAWTMQGGPKPEFLKKNVAYYVMGADVWRYADTLEAVTAHHQSFFLHSSDNPTDVFKSGTLTKDPPQAGEPGRYTYDPRDTGLAELERDIDLESMVDQRMIHASVGKQLIYHSAPFDEDTEISGFFTLSVWMAIDRPDTDFRATVYEVALDGSVLQLTADWMRARYREGLREAKLIDTTEPLRYDFERFTFVSRLMRKGHRLRLVIGPLSSIHSQKNYNSGGTVADESMTDALPVTVRLFHDPAHRSALYMPIGQS